MMTPFCCWLSTSLPIGGYGGTYKGKRYRIVTKTDTSCNRPQSQKLEAEELGGNDYVSFNHVSLGFWR